MNALTHQYVERETGNICTERLYQDAVVRFFYGPAREKARFMFNLLTNGRTSRLLGYLNYDSHWGSLASRRFLQRNNVNLDECVDDPRSFDTVRKVFERKIKYWDCRPMPLTEDAVLVPADARVIIGSFMESSPLLLKGKFFDFEEMLGHEETHWLDTFASGDFAIFRLTPEKYHYNHTPVAGVVEDVYELDGVYHSCNPGAVVSIVTPYSKNRRVVTIINTDTPGGTGVGRVAMVEVVALMIGEIAQCYSDDAYEEPLHLEQGMYLRKGQPKSLFRPGSSTTVLLFQKDRVHFAEDLVRNQSRANGHSRFSAPFNRTLLETDVKVRSLLALPGRS